MLRILGSNKRLCDGVSRREMLTAGGLSMLGLTLPDFLRAQAATDPKGHGPLFGRAKSCILLFLYGSPSQLEFADMKPNAPEEIRGELKSIRSTLPGCDVVELLPHTSRVMHQVTVIRSMTHKYPLHGVAYATTGIPEIDVPLELNPRDGRHWPFMGSVVSYLEQQKNPRAGKKPVPDNVYLPFPFSSQRSGEPQRAGPYAAFLGSKYNPHFTEFRGKATAKAPKWLRGGEELFDEPYVACSPDSTFTLSDATQLPADVTLNRLDSRKSLLEQFEESRRQRELVTAEDPFREMAYSLIGTDNVRKALDVRRESPKARDHYGYSLFGQSCLAARRLVEAGSKFVTVMWDEFGLAGSGWDTHDHHFPRMRNELMPGFDRGYAGLITDLHERGMLDDTLVVLMSEHGRTPKLKADKGGGRDHWSQAYTTVLAGGGVARGRVIGKTDSIGGTVTDRPVSPKDIQATVYHLLGHDLETMLTDRTNRPQPLVPGGQVLQDVLG